jgi:hypothetical protein
VAAASFVTARQRGRGLADERPAAVALGTHDYQRRTIRRSDLKAILKLMWPARFDRIESGETPWPLQYSGRQRSS